MVANHSEIYTTLYYVARKCSMINHDDVDLLIYNMFSNPDSRIYYDIVFHSYIIGFFPSVFQMVG